jgi:hypothetical protein
MSTMYREQSEILLDISKILNKALKVSNYALPHCLSAFVGSVLSQEPVLL